MKLIKENQIYIVIVMIGTTNSTHNPDHSFKKIYIFFNRKFLMQRSLPKRLVFRCLAGAPTSSTAGYHGVRIHLIQR